MTKPQGIRWLEEKTGEVLDRQPVSEGKHLSIRIPADLAERLERLAGARDESVSRAARRLILDGLDRIDHPDTDAIDTAIAVLEKARSSATTKAS